MPNQVTRRTFVIVGSTALAGLAVVSPAHAASPQEVGFVSVGYWDNTRLLRSRIARPPRHFVPAESVLSGDPAFFASGARFRVHDYRRRASSDARAESISVEALYSADGVEEKLPFYAWSTYIRPGYNLESSPTSFVIAVDVGSPLQLALERRVPSDGTTERVTIPLGVNFGEPGLKLNAGTYAIALLRNGEPEPDWRAIRLEGASTNEKKIPLSLVKDSTGEVVPVNFDYLLVSVTPKS